MDFVDKFYSDKDMSLLKKLTVVIPTYNRNYYLSRCLWYHSHFPFGEVIVADSSQEEKKVVNRETVRKLVEERETNIRYLEYPPETERYGGDIIRKWGDAVQHVKAEYSQICTDKEFLIPGTLCKCIAFLDKHNDYDMAAGPRYNMISPRLKLIEFYESNPGRSLSIDYPDPLARLLAFTFSEPDTYNTSSLRRSHFHKYVYNKLLESKINDLWFGELGFEMLSAITSRAIFLSKEPHICRDVVKAAASFKIKRSTLESSASRYPLLDEYVRNGMYIDCIDRLARCLTQEYLSLGSSAMTNQDLNNLMKIAIKNLLIIRRLFKKPQLDILHWGALILSYLPTSISLYVRKASNRPAQPTVADIPRELEIIAQILIKTLNLHNKDKPYNPM